MHNIHVLSVFWYFFKPFMRHLDLVNRHFLLEMGNITIVFFNVFWVLFVPFLGDLAT
jgi:hypothetical protein